MLQYNQTNYATQGVLHYKTASWLSDGEGGGDIAQQK